MIKALTKFLYRIIVNKSIKALNSQDIEIVEFHRVLNRGFLSNCVSNGNINLLNYLDFF